MRAVSATVPSWIQFFWYQCLPPALHVLHVNCNFLMFGIRSCFKPFLLVFILFSARAADNRILIYFYFVSISQGRNARVMNTALVRASSRAGNTATEGATAAV